MSQSDLEYRRNNSVAVGSGARVTMSKWWKYLVRKLFGRLEDKSRFHKNESEYLFHQILGFFSTIKSS